MASDLSTARAERIAFLERRGVLDPTCLTCLRIQYPYYRETWEPGRGGPFAPRHLPSKRCESGKRPHCTCGICF